MSRFFQESFIDQSHIEAFRQALQAEDIHSDDAGGQHHHHLAPSPHLHGSPTGSLRVRKISALSDFAPVNLRVKKRFNSKRHHKRSDYLYLLLRWPILIGIFTVIFIEFGLYVFIRQLVNTKELVSTWRGKRGTLRRQLRASSTYEGWKRTGLQLDNYLHFDEWKIIDEDPYYDWKLVRKVKRSLNALRVAGDARSLLGVLETCLKTNFAGTESARLYSETNFGTKNLIENYLDELELALDFIQATSDVSNEEKRRFFRSANTNLGSSALCLSGGASFGYYHVGVLKAFVDADLLPRVITGTSAGGLLAALVCTRSDEELKQILVPELADKITACEDPFNVWIRRFWKTGARFDSISWAEKSTWFTRGSLTFKEAYLRTGRILNISCIPADKHSPTKLLNYITAPNTVIWSSLLASAAVPGILNPVVLMEKMTDGSIVPWNWGSRFKDGSLRVDIPIQALNLYFNVTHPVVSQANPHVHLFFFAPRGSAGKPVHRKGKGWRGNFLLSAAEQGLKHEFTKNFKIIRDLELLPELLGQDWSSVFLQRFYGSVTIWPRTRFQDWFRILTDPDRAELRRMIEVGQLVTWPKLHMIRNRMRIEKKIYAGRQTIRKAMQPKQKGISMYSRGQSSRVQSNTSPTPLVVDTTQDRDFLEEHNQLAESPHSNLSPSSQHLRATPGQTLSIQKKGPLPTVPDWDNQGTSSHSPTRNAPTGLFRRIRAASSPAMHFTSPFQTSPHKERRSNYWSSESDSSTSDRVPLDGSDSGLEVSSEDEFEKPEILDYEAQVLDDGF